jgi:NitT/TauT family transport system substrate-binding protein
VRCRSYGFVLFVAAALAAAGVSACSSSSVGTQGNGSGPELSTVNVDTLDIADAAPLILAQKEGFFKQQGLNVKITYVASTPLVVPGLLAHTVDFTLENYPGAFGEEAANPALGLRIIADDDQAAPDTNDIMVPKNSPITSLTGLKGKKIAFPALGVNVGALALDEQLRGYGIGPNSYTGAAIAFTAMLAPLARGEVDAAYATQPFATIMEAKIGARPLIDLMSGPMSDFPLTGWGTTAWFIQHYPKTVAAFQRAIEKGQQLAASDPALVRQTLPKFIPSLSPQIANVMPLDTFNTTLSLTRLQRVADVMEQFGFLPKSFDVKPMMVPLPSGT